MKALKEPPDQRFSDPNAPDKEIIIAARAESLNR
jgi:hypothetical protein